MNHSAMHIQPTTTTTGHINQYEYTATYRYQTADWSVVASVGDRVGFGADPAKCVAIVQAANDADFA